MQEDQRHALDRAVANAAVIEQPLAWLLEQPRHEYVPQALQVAAELKLRSLLDRVEALARVPALRAKALKCSDSIEPLPTIVIEELLHNEEREVVLAGVEILARRTPQPSAMLIPLLAREARRAGRRASVHLKVDTGMGRLGCAPDVAAELACLVPGPEFLKLDGLCTHVACADPSTDGCSAKQISVFEEVTRAVAAAGVPVPPRHAAASASILARAAPHLDLVRPGLALYGVASLSAQQDVLRPVLTLKSQVIFLKDFPAGRSIGYERTYTTTRRTRIATLPLGYNDGYPWRLGGRAEVLIRGRRAPVVGRVSMDYLTVDVGRIPGVCVGDEAVLIGSAGDDAIGAVELAERAGTIPYEILTLLGKRVVRTYRSASTGTPEPVRGFRIERRPSPEDAPGPTRTP
jgi:alanine racemase